jgi:hypothetical protein
MALEVPGVVVCSDRGFGGILNLALAMKVLSQPLVTMQ